MDEVFKIIILISKIAKIKCISLYLFFQLFYYATNFKENIYTVGKKYMTECQIIK